MNTDFLSQARRPSIAKLLSAGAAVLVLGLMSIALSMPQASGADRAAATPPASPAANKLNWIDHSQIDWGKVPANPEAVGTSIAAYEAAHER